MASRPDSARDRLPNGETTFGDLLNGFTLDSRRAHRAVPEDGAPVRTGDPVKAAAHPTGADDNEEAPSAVRAYAWTGGRTTPQYRLELETLLSTTERYQPHDESVSSEYHAVAALCHHPTSVAEVAALLKLPLGVAKVLTGDMAAIGLLVVHETASANGETPDLRLMERILSGLRRL